jgi:hypothetical protein
MMTASARKAESYAPYIKHIGTASHAARGGAARDHGLLRRRAGGDLRTR